MDVGDFEFFYKFSPRALYLLSGFDSYDMELKKKIYLFRIAIASLGHMDMDLLYNYRSGISVSVLAEKYSIDEESVRKRIYRAKKAAKTNYFKLLKQNEEKNNEKI